MPRSNKKKKQTFQPAVPTDDKAVALLLGKEKTIMISRAIASAQKHGIKLKHGTSNPGTGDCAFEAAIYNINDRPCFLEKLRMSIDWYRRIWVTDMANRTLNTDYNIFSNEEWLEGWNQMLEPGTYERGIFGDLMLPGIACGTRKYLLIFNTNLNTPHDPIYVVDPTIFNVIPDTEIPVVLSYNMSHYESMEPCTDVDVQMSKDLVQQYLEGRYRYKNQDMPYLLSNQQESEEEKYNNAERRKIFINTKKATLYKGDPMEGDQSDLEGRRNNKHIRSNSLTPRKIKEVEKQEGKIDQNNLKGKEKINTEEEEMFVEEVNREPKSPNNKENSEEKLDSKIHSKKKAFINNLCYRLRKTKKNYPIEEIAGKMICPLCKVVVKNIKLHFNRKVECGRNIDMVHFSESYEQYIKIINQEREKLKRKRNLETDPDFEKKRKQNSRAKMQAEDPIKYRKQQEEESKKKAVARKKLLEADPENEKKRKEKSRAKQQAEDPIKYRKQQEEARKKKEVARKKLLEADPENEKKRKEKSRAKQQAEDPIKYRKQQEEARKKMEVARKKLLEADPENEKKRKEKSRAKQQAEDPIKYRKQQEEARKKEEVARKKLLEADPENEKKRKEKSRAKQHAADPIKYRKKQEEERKKSRAKQQTNVDETERRSKYYLGTIFGPIFPCSSCEREFFEKGVSKMTNNFKEKVESRRKDLYEFCIKEEIYVEIDLDGSFSKSGSYICGTCKASLLKGKIPAMATVNGLYMPLYDENLHLTELENNLIAKNINFQYIYQLPKSRWAATKKQMISVPVTSDTIRSTINQLPRLPSEAGLIQVGIKRKMEYDRAHRKELIDVNKVHKVLAHLKASGNPYYQEFDDLDTYESRCRELDEDGHHMLFDEDNDLDNIVDEGNDIEEHVTEKDGDNSAIEDTIRKHQFDHNRNTCMANNYPEMFSDENGANRKENLSFAPAEGNCPTNLQQEKDWDIKSWPALLANGKFGVHYKRKLKLTEQQYFCQRIMHRDKRFSSSPGYIFAAAAYIEQKQLSRQANISFMRGNRSKTAEGTTQYNLDDAFTTFEGIKNTPKYWQKVKYEIIAKLENIGPFHFFFTLSCGDTRYDENFSSFLVKNNYKIQYQTNPDGTIKTMVKGNNEREMKPLELFLKEDISQSLHEMIRRNVLTATRTFQHRVETFKKEILYGKNNPMIVKHMSYRVEFQGRGAAHIHGVLWLDIKKMENSKSFYEEGLSNGMLSKTFKKLRDDEELTDEEKGAIVKLTDIFISCCLNPDTAHKDKNLANRLVEIIKSVNCHNCTNPCKKYGDKCKYGYPKFPLKKTLFIDKHETLPADNDNQGKGKNYTKILGDVEEILRDEDKVKEIMSKFEKGSTQEEYENNRSKRIDLMLEMAGNICYDDYVMALKKTRKHGSAVLLKRDVDETRVNNYNPEWALAWDANHDLQPTLDFFAVITYVTDYFAKPDEGITQFLREAAAMLKSEPDQRKRCQQMANTFLTHRQMSEVEAYYKIFPHLTLKYSSLDTIFIPTDKKELRSKFLKKLNEDDENFAKGIEVAGGRTGKFIEKPDIIDKFCRRDITDKNPELDELSAIQFGKLYDPIRWKTDDENEDIAKNNEPYASDNGSVEDESEGKIQKWKDEEDRANNFIITTHPIYMYKRLPKLIKIKDKKDGEVPFFVKRSFPKAARFHKKREDNDPHRFFLSELMLYTSYTDEDQLGANDEDKCRKLYLEKRDDIQFVKSYMMPFLEGVEEAQFYVQEAMNEKEKTTQTIGDELDAEKEKEIDECVEEVEVPHPDFVQVNPDEHDFDTNMPQVKKTLRQIEIKTADDLLRDARKLDKFQKQALHIAVTFAQNVIIARKNKISYPEAPFLMIHGGAGSGKSTLIHVMSQYVHKILLKDGDDLECPYVLLSAFTGTAAANINGQTLHTLFSFNFGAGFLSLSDKMRDIKRNLYKNLKLLIIDEISLVDADMLYKIDLRLREITQMGVPLGNVAIFVLGDLMQMRPVTGKYIFEDPRSAQFALANNIDPLWQKFTVINLEINHRQGEDESYANMLNRIRTGNETLEDIEELKKRVRPESHEDIKKEKDALYIYGTNKNVNKMNNKRLRSLKEEEHIIDAITIHKTIKNFDPPEGSAGEVSKTPFQKKLKLKLHSKVMLTYNVDTSDGLTNGARGELIGIDKDARGNISRLVVQFENRTIGQEKMKQYEEISKKYPGGTVIEKVNFPFSISKSKKTIISTAMVIQFPLKLAFACTAHKIQGATIAKPQKAIINTADTFSPAMIYVMLSRVCTLSQIFILNEFEAKKMYPSQKALCELNRLNKISLNNNPTSWEKVDKTSLKISSLNCRSLKKHFQDISSDHSILKSDIICLSETWLDNDEISQDLHIPQFCLHLNSKGKGKGIAIYFKEDIFKHDFDIKEENMQISKFTSPDIVIIALYRSQGGNFTDLNENIELLQTERKPILITGDFNFCYFDNSNNPTRRYLLSQNFSQLIKEPTHLEGHALDQAYLKGNVEARAETQSKYYTDHKGLTILLRKGNLKKDILMFLFSSFRKFQTLKKQIETTAKSLPITIA